MADSPFDPGLGREAQALIAAGRVGDTPSDAARARMRARLMVAISAAAASGTSGATGMAAAQPTATGSAAAGSAATGSAAAGSAATGSAVMGTSHWLWGVALVGTLAVGTAVFLTRADPSNGVSRSQAAPSQMRAIAAPGATQPPLADTAVVGEVPPVAPPTRRTASVRPAEREASTGVATQSARRPARRAMRPSEMARPSRPALRSRPEAAEGAPSTLAAELHLLRTAQQALGAGDAATALAHAQAHRQRFPHGTLSIEGLGVEALALCQLGHDERGRAVLATLRARGSRGPLLARVEAACAASHAGSQTRAVSEEGHR